MKNTILMGALFSTLMIAGSAFAAYPHTQGPNAADVHSVEIRNLSEILRLEGASAEQIQRIIERAKLLQLQQTAGTPGACRGDEMCGGG